MIDWLIIGGGIHGITTAVYLLKNAVTTIDNLRLVDPHLEPLHNWNRCTKTIDMPYLRSPSVHHLHPEPFDLEKFAKTTQLNDPFLGHYSRPKRDLFQQHNEQLIEQFQIKKAWLQDRVIDLYRRDRAWHVITANHQNIVARNVVLAIGQGERFAWPKWAANIHQQAQDRIFHLFEQRFPTLHKLPRPVAIIGGGISAAHTAIKLSTLAPTETVLIKRHPYRIEPFDSDPGWLGPKHMTTFSRVTSFKKRRDMIRKARYKGSIPKELYRKLHQLEQKEHLHRFDGEVRSATLTEQDEMTLRLSTKRSVTVRTSLLATGFEQALPGHDWLSRVIKRYHLKRAPCGFPIVSERLEWAPNLHVTGALAELELGPIARNIAGARKAAERISASVNAITK